VISQRTREAGFMVAPALAGLVGIGAVAAARADTFDLSPLPGAVAVLAIFLSMHFALRVRAPYADPYVLPLVGLLTAIGLIELNRISPRYALDQVIWVGVGGAVFIGVLALMPDHRVLERYRYIIGLTAIGLLVVTMAVGTSINGSKLWIRVGGGQTIQLGELAKVLVVIFLAGYLRDRRELLAIPTHRRLGVPLPPMRHLAPVIAFVAAALAVVAVLNDFGTALLFVGVFLAMLYLATGRIAYPAIGLGFFAAGSVLVYLAVPRIHDRITGWVNPFGHAQTEGYQLVQSLQALGDGGLFGRGLGRGFLLTADGRTLIPELRTDFIFSAVAHELGYIGAVGVLIVFLLLASRGISIAAQANDGFSKLLAGGLTAVLALQAFLIVAGIVRLVPLTGVTLPFMSYGGSSVVTNFGLIALLLVVSNRANAPARPALEEREP
jgi:cell division protein FtsW (lipid II flippase)